MFKCNSDLVASLGSCYVNMFVADCDLAFVVRHFKLQILHAC